MRWISRNFLTGLLVIFPAIITGIVINAIFIWTSKLVINPLEKLFFPGALPQEVSVLARLAILIGFIAVVIGLGFATRVLVVRRFLTLGEALFRKVPMVGKMYGSIREISNTFMGRRKGVFSEVVLLEWPRLGIYAIGFVTSVAGGQVQEKTPAHIINVFVPTTPNPTSGYLVLAPEESLIRLNLSVEEGMRIVVSGGVSGSKSQFPRKGTVS